MNYKKQNGMNKVKELIWKLESTVYLLDEIVLNYRSEDWSDLKARIANHIGVTKGSVNMAIGNLKYILSDGSEGLSAYTVRQEEAVRLTLEKYELSKQKLLMILS